MSHLTTSRLFIPLTTKSSSSTNGYVKHGKGLMMHSSLHTPSKKVLGSLQKFGITAPSPEEP
eukprot:1871058-Prorocentrum_lima.AAC.1